MQLDRLVSSYCSSAYYHLRTINNIRHNGRVSRCGVKFVLRRLDYSNCNALLGGLNNRQLDRIQRVHRTELCRACHLPRQRAWAYHPYSSHTTLATDQDADYVQDMHIHVQSYTWLTAWVCQLFCGTLHSCPCTSIVNGVGTFAKSTPDRRSRKKNTLGF